MASSSSNDATPTPPLLSLPPVLLTHILLHLEPHEIILVQSLTTRHPALACLEEEGPVDGGLWKQAFELWHGRIKPAADYWVMLRRDEAWTDERIRIIFKYREERTLGDRVARDDNGAVSALEAQTRVSKAQFLRWAGAFRCEFCDLLRAAVIQCCSCGYFVCEKPTCVRGGCPDRAGAGPCPFTLCRDCLESETMTGFLFVPFLQCCSQCPSSGRRCPYHTPAGMRACAVCHQGRCGQHGQGYVSCNWAWCPVSLCPRPACFRRSRDDYGHSFTHFRCEHHGDRATLCEDCTRRGRRPPCSYCASPMVEEE